MKYLYSKSSDKFTIGQFVVTTEKHRQLALANGYIEVSDGDYEKLVKHELCWENGRLVPYYKTAEEINAEQSRKQSESIHRRIAELKSNLASWDYKTSKYIDGEYTDSEWQVILAQRQAWRAEINSLEYKLKQLNVI